MGGTAEDTIRDAQKEADKQIRGVQESVDTELTGLTESLKTEAKGFTESVETAVEGAGKSLGMNTEQDFMPKIDMNMPSLSNQKLNLDQDFTRINLPGMAKELTNIGSTLQQEAIDIGSAIQQGAIDAGSALQQNLIRAGSAMQQNAINFGRDISGGQSNPTLEGLASSATKATETNIAHLSDGLKNLEGNTKIVENNLEGITKSLETNFEGVTKTVEKLGTDFSNIFSPGETPGTQAVGGDNLAPAPTIGDPDELPMEQATTKADQMTEEERLRRIRRLMLARYGREDTILSGAGDTRSRRRYAL